MDALDELEAAEQSRQLILLIVEQEVPLSLPPPRPPARVPQRVATLTAELEALNSRKVSPVDEWLAQCKLQRYAGAIKDAGYDEIDFLKEADEAEIDDLASQVEMKVPHAKALKRAWLTLRDT